VDVHPFTLEAALDAMHSSIVILDALEEDVVLKESISLPPLKEFIIAVSLPEGWEARSSGSKIHPEVISIMGLLCLGRARFRSSP